MKNDVDDPLTSPVPCSRPLAKDLLSLHGVFNVTAEIMRNLLESRSNDELLASYGAWPSEALASLNYADLASLPIWDEEILLEVAGAPNPKELAALGLLESNAKRDIDREMWAHEITVKTEATSRIMRRIRLAQQLNGARNLISPAEGVFLLRSAGIEVPHELVDAVATLVLRDDTDESAQTFRELKKNSVGQDAADGHQVGELVAEDAEPSAPLSRASSQRDAILAGLCSLGHDPLRYPKAEAGKAGVKAELRRRLTKDRKDIFVSARVFDDAWQRLRDDEDIFEG